MMAGVDHPRGGKGGERVAKGMGMRKEKKKPKADKDKPKQMSAYKLSQQGSSSSATPKK